MEYEQMRAFITVTEIKNFTRAAEKLHVTQSTITARIKNLENGLGKELLERNTRKVELTTFGKSILPYIKRSLELIEECKWKAKLEEKYTERIVIGSVHSIWDFYLQPYVQYFQKKSPTSALRLVTKHSNEIIDALLDGTIDVGIVYTPPQHPDIEIIPWKKDRFILIGSNELILPNQINLKEIDNFPFIHQNWGTNFSEWFQQEVGNDYIASLEVDHVHLLVELLYKNNGISFVLETIYKNSHYSSFLKPIEYVSNNPAPDQTIYIIFSKKVRNEAVENVVYTLLSDDITN
jgi:DNA-binding transcriptional LysR family regulator